MKKSELAAKKTFDLPGVVYSIAPASSGVRTGTDNLITKPGRACITLACPQSFGSSVPEEHRYIAHLARLITMNYCMAMLLLVGMAVGPALAGDLEVARQAALANQASIQAIHTVHCKVKASLSERGRVVHAPHGEYWRAGETSRYLYTSVQDRNMPVDIVIGSGTAKLQGTDQSSRKVGRIYFDTAIIDHMIDVPIRTLFYFPVHGGEERPSLLIELIDSGEYTVATRQESADGRNRLVIQLISKRTHTTHDYWLAPEKGYLVERKVTVPPPPKEQTNRTTVVTRFIEPAPGIFFPAGTRAVTTGFADELTEVCQFSAVTVNKPIDPNVFNLRFKPGTVVSDLIKSTEYTVKADGTPGPSKRVDLSVDSILA